MKTLGLVPQSWTPTPAEDLPDHRKYSAGIPAHKFCTGEACICSQGIDSDER